jgi:Tol biopolymer transport system component
MVQILMWTLLAVALLRIGAAVPTAHAVLPQTRTGDVAVSPDEPAFTADVSADGRLAAVFTQPYGAGTNQRPARIEIRDLQTRERITLAGGVSNVGTPGRPAAAFSPDGRSVAYTWFDPQLQDTGMLQVIGVERGAQPRTLIPADPSDIGIIPHGWSPDGKRILVLIHGPSVTMDRDPTSLAWVTVADGRMQTIKTLEPWRDGAGALPRLSRDGRWIAYSAAERQGSSERAIHVVDAESGAERRIGIVPGSSSSPVWSPDSSHVVFVNHQRGAATSDLLALDISAPAAPPVRLETAFPGAPIAITNAGTLYWIRFDYGWKGIVMEPSTSGGQVVDEFSGHGLTWLQNNRLAFGRDGSDVIVRTLQSRTERVYPHDGVSALAPRVLGDGSAAILHVPSFGDGGRAGGGFYRIDFTNGTYTRLFSKDDAGRVRSSVSALSPDSRTLYLGVVTGSPSRWSAVVATDVDSGVERRIMALPASMPPVQGMAVSPDGRTLALHTNDGRIFTFGVDDGNVREVVASSPGGGWSEVVRWSRDGQYIVYGTRSDPTSTTWRLMRVQSGGGIAEPAGVDSSRLSRPGLLISFELSPDNGRVALTVRTERRFDVGVMNALGSRFRRAARNLKEPQRAQ